MTKHVNCHGRRNTYEEIVDGLLQYSTGSVYTKDGLKDEIMMVAQDVGIVTDKRETAPYFNIILALLESRGCLQIIRRDEFSHHVSLHKESDRFVIIPERRPSYVVHAPGSHFRLEGGEIVKVLEVEELTGVVYTCKNGANGETIKINSAERELVLFDIDKFEIVQ